MDYNLETLGDGRFQKLCQALLTASYPNVQCLPIEQPDGGRDAFVHHANGFLVFQVKYSKSPATKNERIAISDLIKSEKTKVEALIARGATAYYLMTNISGTSHLDVGSIDLVHEELTSAFGIPSFCWWRDDLERRIESTTGLIWRYPDIFRGSDFLEVLTSGKTGALTANKTGTFRAYVSAQYIRESDVRFQQVQIQNSLLDLFTDTPIGAARDKLPSPDVCKVPEPHLTHIMSTVQQHRYRHYENGSGSLAADWLLAIAPESGLQRIVLEGAPGQGKSTVTQYLAQIQRMRTLRKTGDSTKVPEQHLAHTVRIPLRVDLRDYAAWLTGNDPFAAEKDVRRPLNGSDGIESFLSHQVFTLSGGREFGIDDLTVTLTDSHCLLILDGFDEVADKATRVRLIDQIRSGSERLGNDCCSIQVIVTSRPAAFILSPGFSEREWLHLSLLPMQIEQISAYTDKWIAARSFQSSDGREFKALLLDRVARSHIRSLAQNPMQLAILLSLITTKGRSLPDKRTALYDSYMDLFFGREAEKDETVRENRDVLVQIHQYVAWTLQLDAEKPGGSGSISQADLESLVKQFLISKEHDGDVLRLFTGVVERVGALVSRVEGMLEFEVQPLREYFAGRFLYETAPYSPPGAERGGTRPQRFDALVRRPYWLNVARFYAGCYSAGELASLVSGLKHVGDDTNHNLVSHVQQLSLLFLNDWVFSQEPRTVRDVISFLTSDETLRLLLANRASWEDDRLLLPEKSGRKELVERTREVFLATSEAAYLGRLGLLLRLNLDLSERWLIWEQVRATGDIGFFHASCLGLFLDAEHSRLRELIDLYGDDARQALIAVGRWEALRHEDRVAALSAVIDKRPQLAINRRDGRISKSDVGLYRAYVMANPYIYSFLLVNNASQISFEEVLMRYGVFYPPNAEHDGSEGDESGLFDVTKAAYRASRVSVSDWRTSLEPWSDYIESVRRTWSASSRVYYLAAIAAGIKSKSSRALGFESLLDEKLPLTERARYARLKSSTAWWKRALTDASPGTQTLWVMLLLLAWAPSAVIKAMAARLSRSISELDDECWGDLLIGLRAVISSTGEGRQPLTGFEEATLSSISAPRLKAVLMLRLPRSLSSRILVEQLNEYDGKDQQLGSFLTSRAMNEARRDPKTWRDLITFLKKHNSRPLESDAGQSIGHEGFYYERNHGMPILVAQDVIGSQMSLPLTVLEIAQVTMSRRVGNTSTTLGDLSIEEDWFI